MQRPPKRAPMLGPRQAGATPGAQKERIPVTYGAAGAKPHPTAPYTFVNHNHKAAAAGAVPGNASHTVLPPVEPHGSIITFGAADVPSTSAASPAPRAAGGMPSFGHQPRVSRTDHAPVQLGVEGVRTGEEVVVEVAAPRKQSSADDAAGSPSAELEALKRRLAVSREECKALQEKLQKRKQEVTRTQRLAALVSEEAEARLRVVLKAWEAREACSSALAHQALRQAGEERATQARTHDTQLRAVQAQLDRERADFEARLAALTKDLSASKEAARQQESSESDGLRAQLESLRAELRAAREQHAVEKQTVEARLMGTQQELHTVQNTLQQKLVLLASNELLVAQCRQFVLSICQPGFSVVKGESLEPVDKNRGEPTGFVLIPLMVLLHGYALLPESERRDVIDTYEKKTATLT